MASSKEPTWSEGGHVDRPSLRGEERQEWQDARLYPGSKGHRAIDADTAEPSESDIRNLKREREAAAAQYPQGYFGAHGEVQQDLELHPERMDGGTLSYDERYGPMEPNYDPSRPEADGDHRFMEDVQNGKGYGDHGQGRHSRDRSARMGIENTRAKPKS